MTAEMKKKQMICVWPLTIVNVQCGEAVQSSILV